EDEEELFRDIYNSIDAFSEKSLKHILTNLPILDGNSILCDTFNTSYKCYNNGVVEISAEGYKVHEVVDKLIWADKIKPRDFKYAHGGAYLEFLQLATEYDANKNYMQSIIGYLSHEYKDETDGYIIVCTEQCEDPRDGGGSGKNLFSSMFK